jgi:DNA repair protein RadD
MNLRPYQQELIDGVRREWAAGASNVLAVLPTGGGKTVCFSEVIRGHAGPACAIAHRQELVTQISLALARDGVRHKIIGDRKVVKLAVKLHMRELGRSFYDPSAQTAVAGVDTLIRRVDSLRQWANRVTLWVQDEQHHLLADNKWGKAIAMFPNARGLGVTATPTRADGKGLGRHADGVIDTMVVGPSMRELIEEGYLTEYRVFAPPSDLDLSTVKVSSTTGDYNPNQLKSAVKKSHIVGDVVAHYLKIAPGKLGVTFVPSIELAHITADQFNAAGVPAIALSSKNTDEERIAALAKFRDREYLQLVNVDLFGEGFDLPAIEVVSMARPTQSYSLFAQQFGRALRLMDGKTHAIIIDHVGNVIHHGLPDAPRQWTLDARDKRKRGTPDDGIKLKACPDCTAVYERELTACPMCGFEPVPAGRSAPEQVDGDLYELDPDTLARMRGMVAQANMSEEEFAADMQRRRVPHIGQLAGAKRQRERLETVEVLRGIMDLWAGVQRSKGVADERVSHKRFYLRFGVDVLTAQSLKTAEMNDLIERVNGDLV